MPHSKSFSSSYTDKRESVAFIVGILLCLYLGFHLLAGDRSYLRLLSLNATIDQKESVLSEKRSQFQDIELKVKMMRPDSLNRDFVEERVRAVLGYTYPSEAVVLE